VAFSEIARAEADATVVDMVVVDVTVMGMAVVIVAVSVVDVAVPVCELPRNVPTATETPRRNRRMYIISARRVLGQSARWYSV
jgi:hypothetical protein